MAVVVLSQSVQASITTLVTVATRTVEGATESPDHSRSEEGHVVTARLLVGSGRVPIELFAVLRDEVLRVPGFKHTLGAMRWICSPEEGKAKFEVDIILSDDEQLPSLAAAGGKKRARDEDGLALLAQSESSTALALIGSAPKHMRAWFQETITSLDRALTDVDGHLMRHLDACRIPRVRMPCIQAAVNAFEAAVRASCRLSDRFSIVLTPIETDIHSPCTCLEVSARGRTTVSLALLESKVAELAEKAREFYTARVVVTPAGVSMMLDAVRPTCPTHRTE